MANYGPPGANRDPWAGSRPDEPYGRPDDPRGSGPGQPWPQPHPAYRQDDRFHQEGPYRSEEPYRSGPPYRPDEQSYRHEEPYPPGAPYRYTDHPASSGYGQPHPGGYDPTGGYDHPGGYGPTGGYGPGSAGGYGRGDLPQAGVYPQAGAYPPDPGPARDWYPAPGGHPAGEPVYLDDGRDAVPPSAVPPTKQRGGRGRMVAVLAVLAVLVLGGGAALFRLAGMEETDPGPVTAPPPATAVPSDPGPASSDGSAEASPSALAPESSADPRFAKAGQCVRNDAPAGARPRLLITECAPKTYQVLRRFDGATSGEKDAEAKCGRVDGYTDWYFYNSELDTLDFVLCLKLR